MRSSIATYRESLSRIANEVFDAAEELEIPRARGDDSPAFARRFSRRSSRSTPPIDSPISNGTDSGTLDDGFSQGTPENSPVRVQKRTAQANSSLVGNHAAKVNTSVEEAYNNGYMQTTQLNGVHKVTSSSGDEKGDRELLKEKERSFAAVQASLDSEIKQLRAQLENEREKAAIIMHKLEDEYKRNASSHREISELKIDKERTSTDMKDLRKELNDKMSELQRLQEELTGRDKEEASKESLQSLKSAIVILQKENAELKIEKDELEANLKMMTSTIEKNDGDALDTQNRDSKATEEMASSLCRLEETLKDTCKERDKALQELARLKQHLLDKELEDSDKMDEDSKIIEELQAICEKQKSHILQLERALKQELATKEEIRKRNNDELQKTNEAFIELRKKLATCMSALESKNVELFNLQTALGQYYAESEAKERLGRDLALGKEELAKVSESLKLANQELEISRRGKEDVVAKLSQAERMLAEGKRSIQKLEEDNSKLRRALEQSMTTLNRMSLDSDNYVDRRIVIKLLVTYFQRNHSKEVLDLMVRMLGFSEEDKQRIGFAQHAAGKGVVRGVLGLPGRFVGGILGGHTAETSTQVTSENQSFADMWVDFLLKETEERERRESSGASSREPPVPEHGTKSSNSNDPSFPSVHSSSNHTSSLSKQNQLFENQDAEFATVPLTSSNHPSDHSSSSRQPPRYSY
ncbi:golgin candidate 3-like isoform X1 [Typha angustifolia]|uniref:golgin candidate 3-like isoform X1 n=1 Tax=Typha angustifolia TaxID=59011 RepID=UPI003C2F2DDF